MAHVDSGAGTPPAAVVVPADPPAASLDTILRDPTLLFRLFAEETSDFLSVHDPDGRLRWVSPAIERVLGWTPQERIAMTASLVHGDDAHLIHEVQRALHDGADSSHARVRMRSRDGSMRWTGTNARALRAPDGTVVGIVVVTRDIHDEVLAQQQRSELEQRYRLIAENAADLVLETVDGVFLWVSPSVTALLGWLPDDLVGHAAWEFIHPDDVNPVRQDASRVDAGQARSGRARVLHRDGGYRWFSRTMRPLLDDEGAVVAHVSGLRAIDDQVMAERALAESEQRFRTLAENSSHFALSIDADDRLEWISASVEEVLGWDPVDVVGESIWSYVHVDDRAGRDLVLTQLQAGLQVSARMRALTADGGSRWLSFVATPVLDPAGAYVGAVAGFQDVDDLVHAELGLASSERRFRTAMTAAPLGMALVDLDRRFVEVNPSLCSMLGREAEWFLNHRVPDVLSPDDDEDDLHRRAELLSGRTETVTGERRLVTADGRTLWVQHVIGLLRGDDGIPTGYVSQFLDITEARTSRETLRLLATHDPLTQLANRTELLHRLDRVRSHQPRAGGGSAAVVYLDLDGLKQVNDTFGHATGDATLVEVAHRIRSAVRDDDVVARVGGDEFVVALASVRTYGDAETVVDKVLDAVAAPMQVRGHDLVVTLSAGIALAREGIASDDLLDLADQSLYDAKRRGGARVGRAQA